jgi:hypothetical protein
MGGFSTRTPATANALRLVREFPILQAESYCTAINAQADQDMGELDAAADTYVL